MLTDSSLRNEYLSWLGSELFSEEFLARYLAAFRRSMPFRRARERGAALYDWAVFVGEVEAWATRLLPELRLREGNVEPSVLLHLPEGRCKMTGLRRGKLVSLLCINSAPEDVLRQVPGIGVASARKIVKERARGPFLTLEELVERQCISAASLQLAGRYLSAEPRATNQASRLSPKNVGFVAYVLVRHAFTTGLPLAEVGILELEAAVTSLGEKSYWSPSRASRDPAVLTHTDGRGQIDSLSKFGEKAQVSLIDSAGKYLSLLTRLFKGASSRIWIQTPSTRVLHVRTLRFLLTALVDALARDVDVRVLCDSRYAVDEFQNSAVPDDIAYLSASKVPCRMYPLKCRMHSRVIVVDSEHIVCGSQTWSANSVFNSLELGAYLRSESLNESQAHRFDSLWRAAHPESHFGLNFFRLWPRDVKDRVAAAGITEVSQMTALSVEGIEPNLLESLRRELRAVIEDRLPLSVARRLARTAVGVPVESGVRDGSCDAQLDQWSLEAGDLVASEPFLKRLSLEGSHARDKK